MLKSYTLKDDSDEEDELVIDKDLACIKEEIASISDRFNAIGYMLKYYEDVVIRNANEAERFMVGGRFGYPALYKQGSIPVLVSEGRRDQHCELG